VAQAEDDLLAAEVTMLGYTVDLDELARCRKLVEDHAESFGIKFSELRPENLMPSWSGAPPAAAKVVGASHDLHVAARTEFSAAQEFLRRIAQELSHEGARITDTELSNAAALQRLSTTLR
jgi:hypothetical protein